MMFARLLRIAFAAAFVIAVSSCEERPDEELSNGIDFMYCPRDCEYVHVNAFSESDAAPYVEGDLPLIWGLSDAGRAIPADNLCLRVDVGSYTEEMLEESGLDPHWNFLSAHDGQMEDQMTRYLFLSFTDVYDGSLPVFVEYRKEVCREIEIMTDMNLFGRAPGEDLSGYIGETKSSFGRGGMLAKCRIAIQTASKGIETVIANGRRENIILSVLSDSYADVPCTRFLPAESGYSSLQSGTC